MKILIVGAGKMGKFFCDLFSSRGHNVALFDIHPENLLYTFNCLRFASLDEIDPFGPDLVLNAATVKYTIPAYEAVLPHVPQSAVLTDIASVKTGLPEFYEKTGHRFVSTHPMFGPTFASLSNLADENAIIIKEGDEMGKAFFRDLYRSLGLNIADYSFEEHDLTTAYSLSLPFASTLVFAGIMKHQDAPGTTFKRHLAIARGLMSEDDYLLQEILFNPNSGAQLQAIRDRLAELQDIVESRDAGRMKAFLDAVRGNLD